MRGKWAEGELCIRGWVKAIQPNVYITGKRLTSERVQSLLSKSPKNAKWTNCRLVLISRSQFFQSRLFLSSQAKLRSTTQRLGMTLKVCSSLRLAI